MTNMVKDLADMTMEEIHEEAQFLVEKLQNDFEEGEWEAEKTMMSLGFINWDLCILGQIKKIKKIQ